MSDIRTEKIEAAKAKLESVETELGRVEEKI